jgi:hypothetical protein
MYLSRREMNAAHVYVAQTTGDRQDLKAKMARVQDNAEELLHLIRAHVTEEMAQKYSFVSNIVRALEIKGYGRRIRFKEKDDSRNLQAIARYNWKLLMN